MSEALFSNSWYRVKDLTPRLRRHARIHRHVYRGEVWYVLQDSASDRFHRFTPTAHAVIGMLDGRRRVDEVWLLAQDELGDDAPTQDEMIRLLGQLHAADLLQSNLPPDVAELFDRHRRHTRRQLKSRIASPFAIRIHLFDPERLLDAMAPLARPLFGWAGALLWLAVVLPAAVLAAVHWGELTEGIVDRLFTPGNLLAAWLLFPILKALHELGHGLATKAFGGEVHDMGVMLLVFTPVPYVDASSSWAFASKRQRALVGAGGMVVEVFVAALALYVWLGAEPGLTRAVAYNALMIGGLTTLLFNANPLLRFDGYYILSDLIEVPNLRQRGSAYLGHLTERYLFGQREGHAPHTAPGERAWLVLYPIAAFVYRIFIVAAILTWILDQFFFVGLVLGVVAGVGWIGVPLYKGARFLLTSPRIRRVRGRALAVTAAGLATVALLLAVVPYPLRANAEGVVWIPDESFVRPHIDGFVEAVLVEAGQYVEPGTPLFRLSDPELEAERAVLAARVWELEARYAALRTRDIAEAEVTREALIYARQSLARAEQKTADLEVRARSAGHFILPRHEDLPGRFVQKGQLMAHVVDLDALRVRVVVGQDDVQLVSRRLESVEVRAAERIERVVLAELVRTVPAASRQLPSSALGAAGGGEVPVDPVDPSGDRAVQTLFEIELALPDDTPIRHLGGRVFVRFDLGREPVGVQLYRRVRQIFLGRFHV